jgi:hypothetical protein
MVLGKEKIKALESNVKSYRFSFCYLFSVQLTAIRNYSIFSDEITLGIFVVFWNGADPGIAEIKDAKKRVEG